IVCSQSLGQSIQTQTMGQFRLAEEWYNTRQKFSGMTWFKEAVERRTVSPYKLTDDPVQATFSFRLLHAGNAVDTDPKQVSNWKIHKKKIINPAARWDLFDEAHAWDTIRIEAQFSISQQDNLASIAAQFGLDAICRTTRF